MADKLGFPRKPDSGKETPVRHQAKESSAVVVVHSDAIINIDRCIKALEDRIGLEYARKCVDADTDVIDKLTDKQVNS